MKKFLVMLLAVVMLASVFFTAVADQEETKILFRGLPWRAKYSYVKSKLSDLMLLDYRGEVFSPYSIADVMFDEWTGDYEYEYTDIDIFAYAMNQTKVAGYTTSNIFLYFVYVPVDGQLIRTNDHAALYGATYRFEPENVDLVYSDLLDKLTELYGPIYKDTTWRKENYFGYDVRNVIWIDGEGILVLGKKYAINDGFKDRVWISYLTSFGDKYLQAASDAEKSARLVAEEQAAESNDNTGL